MKRSVIATNKHGIYKLPHELSNDLRLRKALPILAKNSFKIEIESFPHCVISHEN